jgi:hypothetical protein
MEDNKKEWKTTNWNGGQRNDGMRDRCSVQRIYLQHIVQSYFVVVVKRGVPCTSKSRATLFLCLAEISAKELTCGVHISAQSNPLSPAEAVCV